MCKIICKSLTGHQWNWAYIKKNIVAIDGANAAKTDSVGFWMNLKMSANTRQPIFVKRTKSIVVLSIENEKKLYEKTALMLHVRKMQNRSIIERRRKFIMPFFNSLSLN